MKIEAAKVEDNGGDEPPEGGAGQASLSQVFADKLQEVKQALADRPDNKELKKAAKQIEKDYLPRAQKYEGQERKLTGVPT